LNTFNFSPTANKSLHKSYTKNNQHKSIFSYKTNFKNNNDNNNLNINSVSVLNTSINTSSYFSNKNVNNSNYFKELNSNNTSGLNLISSFNINNQSKCFLPTHENYQNTNLNINILSDSNINNFNNDYNRYQFNNNTNYLNIDPIKNKKNINLNRINTFSQDETAEEFSRELENPNRKETLISQYMKKKKVIL